MFNFEAMEQPHRAASPIAENVNIVIKFLRVECDFIKICLSWIGSLKKSHSCNLYKMNVILRKVKPLIIYHTVSYIARDSYLYFA